MKSMAFTTPLDGKGISSSATVPAMQTPPFIQRPLGKFICPQHGRVDLKTVKRFFRNRTVFLMKKKQKTNSDIFFFKCSV